LSLGSLALHDFNRDRRDGVVIDEYLDVHIYFFPATHVATSTSTTTTSARNGSRIDILRRARSPRAAQEGRTRTTPPWETSPCATRPCRSLRPPTSDTETGIGPARICAMTTTKGHAA
jgi:hypothetical protein